jgi:hypothetical protein
VSLRPLVSVSGLTLGDYLLWNWSLNGNHDAIALVSGLTLPPLALAFLWLLALSVARLLAFATRSRDRRERAQRAARKARQRRAASEASATPQAQPKPASAQRKGPGSSGKIAA